MNKKTTIDLNNLTPQQQQNLDNLFAEIKYLTPEQSSAISDPEKMTQEIFNSIELRRMEIGPELEDLTIELFFRYPEFAINYTDRLERALFCQDITVEELEPYESMRQAILKEFDYDIGDIEE
jgi:hypothetical protein